jgi:RHS repeat-associated protein
VAAQAVPAALSQPPFTYQYNLASGIASETYPSNRVVATSYDLQNRPWNVSAGTTTYVNSTNTSYAPQGALAQLQFGTAASPIATQTFTYDPIREQPTATTVTAGGAAGAQLLSLGYAYCPGGSSCSTNNGNPLSQQITTPPMLNATTDTIINQTYVYDKLNRLALAVENPTAAPNTQSPVCQGITGTSWCQQYSPGEYGNNVTSSVNLGTFSAPAAFDNTTNRISPNNGTSGWNYDLAGNLNRDSANATYAFDAEGRMTAACPNQSNPALCTNQWATGQIAYTYDGNGTRVQVNRADGTTTTYVYDGSGSLAAEYGAEPGITATGTQYMVSDFLGSTRMVLSSSGCPQSRQDYLPFGYLIPASVGTQRSQIVDPCYSSTVSTYSEDAGVRQKFTGKERDAETGLDYFQARYMSSAQGRFTSPDPSNLSVDFWLPQTWNRYSYALNNPLSVVDRNGLWPWYIHNEIINEAFPGLSKDQLKTLTDASWNMDYKNQTLGLGPQDPAVSPQHYMSNGNDPDEAHALGEAIVETDQFIDRNEADARVAQANWIASGHTGVSPNALAAFGNALHTVQDGTSPAHMGHQRWRGEWAYMGLPALWHVMREAIATPAQRRNAVEQSRQAFLNTFGFMELMFAMDGLQPQVTSTIKYQ